MSCNFRILLRFFFRFVHIVLFVPLSFLFTLIVSRFILFIFVCNVLIFYSEHGSMSISDLELGTVLALTREPQPDSETLDASHERITDALAAVQQHPLLVKYLASLSSDKTIAQILQNDENVASHCRCAVFVVDVRFRFASFTFTFENSSHVPLPFLLRFAVRANRKRVSCSV